LPARRAPAAEEKKCGEFEMNSLNDIHEGNKVSAGNFRSSRTKVKEGRTQGLSV